MKIGVLALQGSFAEHEKALGKLGAETVLVKTTTDLGEISGLIIPGGESTTMFKLMNSTGLFGAICDRAKKGMPVYGTCAGAILMSKEIDKSQGVEGMGLIDILTSRNAYGNQLDSFETTLKSSISENELDAVFIRAPKIIKILSDNVSVLASYKGEPVMVQEGKCLASTYHPELTNDLSVHSYFLSLLV